MKTKNMNDKLKEIIDYLNETYNQQTGKDPENVLEKYDDKTLIAFTGIGAYVVIENMLFEIGEDDGFWFEYEADDGNYSSVGWAVGKERALHEINKYLKKYGTPTYYVLGTDKDGNTIYSKNICCYIL